MKHHIVKIALEYSGDRPMPERDYAKQIFPEIAQDLESVAERISGEQGSQGLFLVGQSALLQWMASNPIHYKEIQIHVFSLQAPEGQLAFQGGVDGCGVVESYRISKRTAD